MLKRHIKKRIVMGLVVGAVAGYALAWIGKMTTDSFTLASDTIITTVLCALAGATISMMK